LQTLRREPSGAICVPVFKPLLFQVKQLQSPPITTPRKCRRSVNLGCRGGKAL